MNTLHEQAQELQRATAAFWKAVHEEFAADVERLMRFLKGLP